MKQGIFYLVPVPIGNLNDMTFRAIETLNQVDLIFSEDTRVSKILLAHYEINTPLLSYHQHNEKSRIDQILSFLREGENLALISDAGTPLISDPGFLIVEQLTKLGFQVISLPGANAAITALIASGLDTRRFTFWGFIEKAGKARQADLAKITNLEETVIIYEAPHRLERTLKDMCVLLSERKIAIGRELTKKFETYFYGTLTEAIKHYQTEEPRGEFVLILEGKKAFLDRNPDEFQTDNEEVIAHLRKELAELIAGGMSLKAAASYLAAKTELSKNIIYQIGLEIKTK